MTKDEARVLNFLVALAQIETTRSEVTEALKVLRPLVAAFRTQADNSITIGDDGEFLIDGRRGELPSMAQAARAIDALKKYSEFTSSNMDALERNYGITVSILADLAGVQSTTRPRRL